MDEKRRELWMKSKALTWVALAGFASVFLGRPSRSQTTSPGTADPGSSIPQGSQAICQGVPAAVALIPDLRTGRAISVPGTTSVRLLFSSQPLACQDSFDGINTIALQRCVSVWAFSILLPAEIQQPGVYQLAQYPVEFQNSIVMMGPPQGCGGACGAGSASGGASASSGPSTNGLPGASVEIYSVTDQCITGRFQGLTTGQIQPPPPDINGAFHAVRCTPSTVGAADR
jgi:hypothetical protein